MRDPARIPLILDAVRKAWEKNPDLRLGQLIMGATPAGKDTFSLEDDVLLQELENPGVSLQGTRRITKDQLQAASHDVNEKFGSVFEALASGDTHPEKPEDLS